jgi:hypothetical protein
MSKTKLITPKEINDIKRTAEIAEKTRQIVNTIYRPSITDANYCPVRRGVHWIYRGGTK